MSTNSIVVKAVFENGVFRPTQPVSLPPQQPVTLTVLVPRQSADWPADVAEIYAEIAEEDCRLAQAMWPTVVKTWPASEAQP